MGALALKYVRVIKTYAEFVIRLHYVNLLVTVSDRQTDRQTDRS
jgi:hypothetical protein